MGRHAFAALGSPFVQTVVAPDDVDGEAAAFRIAMADGIIPPVDFLALGRQLDVVTEQTH